VSCKQSVGHFVLAVFDSACFLDKVGVYITLPWTALFARTPKCLSHHPIIKELEHTKKSNTDWPLDMTDTQVWGWHVVVQIRSQSRLDWPSGRHLGSSPWKSDWAHGKVPREPGVHSPQGGKDTVDPELTYTTTTDSNHYHFT